MKKGLKGKWHNEKTYCYKYINSNSNVVQFEIRSYKLGNRF